MEREELADKARKGDAHAFALLYEELYEGLYRYAFYMLQNRQDAEDAVSEAVLSAYAGIHKLRKAEAFRGWMYQIVTNVCRKKRGEYRNQASELLEVPVDWLETEQEMLDVRKALLVLEEEDRQIIGMSVLAGYNSREIGRVMHMKPATVRSRLKRGLDKVRRML